MFATLKFPVMGFTEIRLIIKRNYKWLVELVGADLEIEVSESDFVIKQKAGNLLILDSSESG